MHSANIHRPTGHWPKEKAVDTLTLDSDTRHRRRIRMTADQGEEILLDLPKAVTMEDGDGLQLDDGRWLKIQAAPELLVEIRHKDPNQRVRLAWHLEIDTCPLKSKTRFFAFGPTMSSRICSTASEPIS